MARFHNLRVYNLLYASKIAGGADNSDGDLTLDAKGGSEIVLNEDGRNVDTRMEGDSVTDVFLLDASADRLYLKNTIKREYITSVTTSYSVLATDELLSVKTSNGAITLTLPSLGTPGQRFLIKDAEGYANLYNITINAASTEVIETSSQVILNQSWSGIELIDDTTRWLIIRTINY